MVVVSTCAGRTLIRLSTLETPSSGRSPQQGQFRRQPFLGGRVGAIEGLGGIEGVEAIGRVSPLLLGLAGAKMPVMAETDESSGPWMIAAWPGMGNVAIIAATYLIEQLGIQQHGELASHVHFNIGEIVVKNGLVVPARLPRGLFFRLPEKAGARDLVVSLGEAQPTSGVFGRYEDRFLDLFRRAD